ncbi:MAG: TnpV protein [Coprococcus sp.]
MKENPKQGFLNLNRITGGVINGGDNETQGLTVEEMLYESVLYAVGTRCGFDMSAEEQDMSFIINISDEDDIYRFGSLVCDVSCSVLKEFNYRVRRIEKERSVTNGRKENNLSRGRRNAVSESGIATGTEISMTQIGKYGMMAAEYLKKNERNRYNTLYRLGRLAEKMKEVDTEANSLMDTLMTDYLRNTNLRILLQQWKCGN